MKYYLAPMEGITGYVYRNAYNKYFHNIDKYFTPFIIPNKSRKLKTRELRDVLPENNKDINVIPQILTNNAEHFISTTRRLQEFGYNEVNLNLGCPSRTVVSRFKGSGFLAKREELDIFLDEIYKMDHIKISIKTRIGKENPEEFYELLKIYNKYPISELIIHPRTQRDYYNNKPNLKVFSDAIDISNSSICYNGNIFTQDDYYNIYNELKDLNKVMLGRGIISNPALMDNIKGDKKPINKQKLKDFHDEIVNEYLEMFHNEVNVLFKMKELWGYMIYLFSNNTKYGKKIRKSKNLSEYKDVVEILFINEEILQNPEIIWRT